MVNIEDVQREIIDICEKNYGTIDHNRYFISENDTVNNVRQTLLDGLTSEEYKKGIYLDMTVYILQMGKNVFISLN